MPKTSAPQDLTQLTLVGTDEGKVTLTSTPDPNFPVPTNYSFVEDGYIPLTAQTLSGNPLHVPAGYRGLYLHYTGIGTNHPDPANAGNLLIDYTKFNYELYAYKGNISFSHDSTGAVVPKGATATAVQLAAGSISSGELVQNGDGVGGHVVLPLQTGSVPVGSLDLNLHHTLGEIGPAAGGITLTQGQVTATYILPT